MLDFSENYSCIIQQEAQGYHWNRASCSLYPLVVYTKGESPEQPTVTNLCILSDDSEHDTVFVHESQRIVIKYLHDHSPLITSILYFSDGCAGQYKNCKHFYNVCHHQEDFNLRAPWAFFATSHGKSPCDGIGGTVKRLAVKASLQIERRGAIDTAEKLYNFCTGNITGIKFWLIKKEEMSVSRQELQACFSAAKTIPGTRGFHHFTPLTAGSIAMKRVSFDEKSSLLFSFNAGKLLKEMQMVEIMTNAFVACIYDGRWYFGLVLGKNEEEQDVEVSCLHLPAPSTSFYWPPHRGDRCFVPISHIITTVNAPMTNSTGRLYYFSQEDVNIVQKQYAAKLKLQKRVKFL